MDDASQKSTQEINEDGRRKEETQFVMDEIKDMRSNKKMNRYYQCLTSNTISVRHKINLVRNIVLSCL